MRASCALVRRKAAGALEVSLAVIPTAAAAAAGGDNGFRRFAVVYFALHANIFHRSSWIWSCHVLNSGGLSRPSPPNSKLHAALPDLDDGVPPSTEQTATARPTTTRENRLLDPDLPGSTTLRRRHRRSIFNENRHFVERKNRHPDS